MKTARVNIGLCEFIESWENNINLLWKLLIEIQTIVVACQYANHVFLVFKQYYNKTAER